ncbi:MAG: leucine-rich repeat domain-containing protein [Ruminococcus sp.]|nr:leucine-rich repeat domain-containing protein [Ruminococcus sp.]
MLCEKCRNELNPNAEVCARCGTPVSRNVAGFENTMEIKKALKSMMEQYGQDLIVDKNKFISLLNDFIPEYEKERRLLKNMLQADVLNIMLREKEQQNIGIMKAKEFMLSEMFLSEKAVEFTIVCFTYMLGWNYTPKLVEQPKQTAPPENAKSGSATAEKKNSAPAMPTGMPFDVGKVFRPMDAGRYRLKGNVKIPEGYTAIESFTFDGFGFMKTATLPDGIVSIGEYAFSECKRLKSIEIPPTLRILKRGAFFQCGKLNIVKLPNGVFEIGDNTFSFCHSLEIVDIPESVSSIGAEAFSGCESLRKLYLSENVKYIADTAFSYCQSLTIRCYENSYVHKFCLNMGIKVETVAKGTPFGR